MAIDPLIKSNLNRYFSAGANMALGDLIEQLIAGGGGGGTWNLETFVLSSQNIIDGFVDLSLVAIVNSIIAYGSGYGPFIEGASYDYTVSLTGGVGGKTRVTFLNNLVSGGSALEAGNVVQVRFQS